jgi:hypothetical protein
VVNSGEGVAFLVREVALKHKEAPGPMQREWKRVSGPVHGEWRQIGGVTGGRLTSADKQAAVEDIVHERVGGAVFTWRKEVRQCTAPRRPCTHTSRATPGSRQHPFTVALAPSAGWAARGMAIELLAPASRPCSDGTVE